jgi:hypothetical protein
MKNRLVGPIILLALCATSVPAFAQDAASLAARGVVRASEPGLVFSGRADLERQLLTRWGSQLLSKGSGIDPAELATAIRSVPRGRLMLAAAATDAESFYTRLAGRIPDPRFTTGALFIDHTFFPITSCRIIDTRLASAGKMAASETRAFRSNAAGFPSLITGQGGDASGCPDIPVDPPGILFTLTIADAEGNGNARAWPFGSAEPLASNINFRTSVNIANTTATNTAFAIGSDFNIKTTQAAHIVADVVGYFLPKDKTVDLQVMSTATSATVQTGTNMGLGFADGAFEVFRTTAYLPDDYSDDTPMAIRFLFSINETACAVNWSTNNPLRVLFDGSGTTNVLTATPDSSTLMVPGTANTMFETIIDLTVDSSSVFAGDVLTLSWFRSTTGDTCAQTLILRGAQLLYL